MIRGRLRYRTILNTPIRYTTVYTTCTAVQLVQSSEHLTTQQYSVLLKVVQDLHDIMPPPKPKLKIPVTTKAIANLVRSPTSANKLKKQSPGGLPDPESEPLIKKDVEIGESSQAQDRASEETVRATPKPMPRETRNTLEAELPGTGTPVTDDEDPFPKQTKQHFDQIAHLYTWFDNCDLQTPVFDLVMQVKWDLFSILAQKMLFIHGERRLTTALQENQTLRIEGKMLGKERLALRAFADADIVDAERKGAIMKLEDWNDKFSNPQTLQVLEVTIAAMAKLHKRIDYQNTSLAYDVAQGYLMSAWIGDARARLYYLPTEGANQLNQFRFGARVLLNGAVDIHRDITVGVASFNKYKGWAMELEKLTGIPLGFEHLREKEKAQDRYMGTHFRFGWDNYNMDVMFWRPVQGGLFDLWRTSPNNLSHDLWAMLHGSYVNGMELKPEMKRELVENFTLSLALGARRLHQIDAEVKKLKRVMKERWKDVKVPEKEVKGSEKEVKGSEKEVEGPEKEVKASGKEVKASSKGKAPVRDR